MKIMAIGMDTKVIESEQNWFLKEKKRREVSHVLKQSFNNNYVPRMLVF